MKNEAESGTNPKNLILYHIPVIYTNKTMDNTKHNNEKNGSNIVINLYN
jgi:hypothetical protein